ncbi:MAG: hypothetical protein KGZ59_08435 [Chitinophagaceae bacterium]|nr:hypothetical protein [Chitinophagaceae bacterium]
MNLTKIYKWLTYILAIPTAFIAFFSLFGILIAIANPQMLIPVFIMICIVVYYISSFIFLQKVLTKNLSCKKIIKDLIKINAIATLIFSALNLIQIISIYFNPDLVETTVNAITEQNQGNINTIFTKQQITTLFYTISAIVSFFAVLLITHIIIGFKLLKEHNDSFLTD